MYDLKLPKNLLILIALTQGLMLLFLHESIEHHFWPHNSPQWLFAFFTIAIAGPLLFLLSLTNDNKKKLSLWIGLYILLSALVGYYVGSQTIPQEHLHLEGLIFGYVATMGIAAFKVTMYAQQKASHRPLSYSQLFQFSWRNFLTLALSALFTLVFWGILMLWAALFKLIKIQFFYDLFTEEWFFYPVLALANGFGVIIFRNQAKVIDTIKRIQQALMKFLLLILIFISLLFLFTLPFTGLEPLWQTKSGSVLIFWMQALILFFLNAVYQDEIQVPPYHLFLHRFIYFGVALLPVYSAISLYGLTMRIDQYGWTIDRCWGVLVWVILTLFSVGYLWGIIKRRDQWIVNLSWVNIRMGLVVLGSMLLINSPVIDFRKISVNSQMARLASGEVEYKDFDYRYFKRNLAAPGYHALQNLKEGIKDIHPDIVLNIDRIFSDSRQMSQVLSKEELVGDITVWPDNENLPEDFLEALYQYSIKHSWQFRNPNSYNVLAVDINLDGSKEYVLFVASNDDGWGRLFSFDSGKWKNFRLLLNEKLDLAKVNRSLSVDDIEIIQPRWRDLKVGDYVFEVGSE